MRNFVYAALKDHSELDSNLLINSIFNVECFVKNIFGSSSKNNLFEPKKFSQSGDSMPVLGATRVSRNLCLPWVRLGIVAFQGGREGLICSSLVRLSHATLGINS